MKRKSLLLMMLLALFSAGAWAQTTYSSFTATAGTAGANSSEDYAALVDGNTSSKWCVTSLGNPTYIEFNYSSAIVPTGYTLTTGGDTQTYPGRNPKSWKIMASTSSSTGPWELLTEVTGDDVLQATNTTSYDFNLYGNGTAYRYFRFEISAIQSGSTFQLAELRLKNETNPTPVIKAKDINGTGATLVMYSGISGNRTLQYGTNSSFTSGTYTEETISSGTATKTLSGLTTGTTYYARVKNNNGGDWSNVVSFTPETIIGSLDNATDYTFLPTHHYYNYSLSQQIYTAEDIGMAGKINSVGFYYSGTASSPSRNLEVYMSSTSLSAITAWTTENADNKVFDGTVTLNSGWNTITLSTSFTYDGTSNLLLTVYDKTGSYTNGSNFKVMSTTNNMAAYKYNDTESNVPKPTEATGTTNFSATNVKNILKLGITPSSGATSKPLPYSYGFENNDLAGEGWTMVDCDGSTGINSSATMNGSYGFQFRYNTTPPQYLVSPQLTGTTDGVDVEFYYKNSSTAYPETFSVGYSTSSSDPTSFTYGEEITISDGNWTKYEGSFPAGTKYVAIKLLSNDKLRLYLDDFSFTAPTYITEITSVADWNAFCDAVNRGHSYSGEIVTLANDISGVTTMAGTSSNPFSGTFDGQGNKITLNLSATENICAPFRYINGATIQNLKVDGTVNGNGYKQLSGLVGIAAGGSSTIYNCLVSATLTTTFSGDSSHGSFVMQQNSGATLTIEGCAFTGTFDFDSSYKFAGFVGWRDGSYPSLTITNCMFAPASLTYDNSTTEDNNQSQNFMRNGSNSTSNFTLTNSYYTTAVRTSTQGKQAYSVTGGTDINVAVYGSATSNYGASGISVYGTTGMVHNGTLYAGNGDNVQLNITYSGSLSGYALEATNGALSGTANPYTLAKGTGNTVISVLQKKYHIANTVSATQMTWDQFAALVNSGISYSGETVYLDENITTAVTVSVGTGSGGTTPFSGTFDGGGHTLTVNIPSSGSAGNAPFYHIVGATIKDLVVTGTVNAGSGDSNRHAAGLVGYSWSGTNTIENCLVSTNVTTSTDYVGGIIGHGKTSNIIMRGCVYSGTITATGTSPVGGLVGWSDNLTGLTIEDCFFNGNYSNSNSSRKFHPIGCTGHGDQISTSVRTITNTYYTLDHSNLDATTQTLVYDLSDKGKFAYTITGQGTVTVDNAGTAHTYSASGITSYGTGILFDNVLYAGDGDEVSLTLNGSSVSYDADYGTLTGSGSSWTLAMEANNTVISAVNCFAPTNLIVSGLQATSATLTWEGGDAGYNVELGTVSTTTGTVEVLNEGFESGALPSGWTLTSTGSNNWSVSNSVCNGNNPYAGSYAIGTPKGTSSRSEEMYLITPTMDLSDAISAELHFYYCNKAWSPDTDPFKVYYRIGVTGEWHELFSTTDAHGSWTEGTITLTNLAADYQIGFYRKDNYAYGAAVDDIVVTKTYYPTTWSTFASNVTSPYTFNGETGTEYLVRVSSTCGQVSNEVTFTPQTLTYVFTNNSGEGNGNWNTLTNWQYSDPNIAVTTLPTINDNVQINAACTIPSGCLAQANEITFLTEDQGSITIKDGGQLQHNNADVVVTVERVIPAYLQENEGTNLGYKIISFPPVSGIAPRSEFIKGLLTDPTNPYDFYTFDYNNLENVYLEWVHVNVSNDDLLYPNMGFLYASQNGTTISVTGDVAPSNVDLNYEHDYVEGDAPFNGWKLVGNPFVCNAYLTAQGSHMNFYEIQEKNGYAEFFTIDDAVEIPPMGGVMVWLQDDDNLVYSRTAPSKGPGILNMDVNKASMRGTTMLDRARVRFGEGRNLKKLQLNPRHTKLYIPEDGNDFSVYYAEGAGTIPVNFKAQDNGSYTLSFSTEDVSFNYLHLIDNMNGNDVDLLQTPYYTFDAKSTDFASRFTLVFATGNDNDDTFAFFNNGVWIINNPSTGSGAEATLQVVDVLGHILSCETISGSCSKAINVAPGVYMLRIINGNDVKVQKIVVR